ncbi:MAG: TldD/PmbA family protein [Candidatus Diapherotrites archaeon]|nr:TldD/PmbA family protein [Candidatus Diapherotrites archaeon]
MIVMAAANELKDTTERGTRLLEKHPLVKEAEVYASENTLTVLRIGFSSNIPSNGLEEAKQLKSLGVSVRVLFKDGKIGFGKEDADLSVLGVKNAFEKARKNTVMDKDFQSLPNPSKKKSPRMKFDKKIADLDEDKAIDSAYACINGALDFLEKKRFTANISLTGELDFLSEKMSVSNSNGVKAGDQNTSAIATLTSIFELERDISGMWFDSSPFLKKLDAYNAGRVSAEKAHSMKNAATASSGVYPVVFGPLAVTEILNSRFEASMSSVEVNASPYKAIDIGRKIYSEQLTILDNAVLESAIGSKNYSDEGIPAQKTMLVEKGKLVSFLSNDYYAKKFSDIKSLSNANGFRFGGGGRHHDSEPGISATNLEVRPGKHAEKELLEEVGNGLYIGRMWYTYPVNGFASPDFTSTVRGDSFVIKNGRIENAVVPNTLRISESIDKLLNAVLGVGKKQLHSLAWGQEAVVITPAIAVKECRVEKIAVGLYS